MGHDLSERAFARGSWLTSQWSRRAARSCAIMWPRARGSVGPLDRYSPELADNLKKTFQDLTELFIGYAAKAFPNPLYGERTDLADLHP